MIQRRIAAVRRFHVADRLAALALPTLFIAADDDMLVPPSCSRALAAAVPAAQFARLAAGGHACTVTRPDNFNLWMSDWLDTRQED